MRQLTDDDITALHARHRSDRAGHERGPTLAHLIKLVTQTRRQGYSATQNLVADGVSGVGLGFEVANRAHAAICVGAISSRMTDVGRCWITALMAKELQSAGGKLPEAEAPAAAATALTR